MTAEMDERNEVSEFSNLAFERKNDLNLSSCKDPCKVGGDCNGIVHDITEEIDGDAKDDITEEIDGDAKDDTDCSYVFVNGIDTGSDDLVEKDDDADSVLDPTEAVETKSMSEEKVVSESNVDYVRMEGSQDQVEEARVDKGENEQSFKETLVSSSNHNVAVGGLQDRPNVDEVRGNDTLEGQNETEVTGSEFQQLNHRVQVEGKNGIGTSTESEENIECQDIAGETFEHEFQQLDDRTKVDKPNQQDKRVDYQEKSDSAAELKENQILQVEVIEAVKSDLHLHNDGMEKIEEQGKTESPTNIEDYQESEVMVANDTKHNFDKDMKETEKVIDEILVDCHPKDIGIEKFNSEMAVCPVYNSKSELDAGTASIENSKSSPSFPANDVLSGTMVVNSAADDGQNMPAVNELVSNAESLPCHLEGLKSETEGGNITTENDKSRNFPNCAAGDTESETEFRNSSIDSSEFPSFQCEYNTVESSESFPSFHVEDTTFKPVGNDSVDNGESMSSLPIANEKSKTEEVPSCNDDVKIEFDNMNVVMDSASNLPACTNDVEMETGVVNGSVETGNDLPSYSIAEWKCKSEVENISCLGISDTCSTNAVKLGFEVPTGSVEYSRRTTKCVDVENEGDSLTGKDGNDKLICQEAKAIEEVHTDGTALSSPKDSAADDMDGKRVDPNGSVESSESASKCVNDVTDVENEGDSLNGRDGNDKPICQEAKAIEEILTDGTTLSSPEDSTADDMDVKKVDAEVGRRPFRFLIRIPRYIDDNIREKIRISQLQVDERTQSRDAIRVAMQMKRATCSEYRGNFEAAKSEEIAARDALTSKRQEMESVQTMINKMKNAASIEEIDFKMQNMEHMIQHETIPLKEEKQLIREIKQLKHIREQLFSNIGSQDELQQAMDQRDKIEERFKIMKKELDALRNEVLRTEGITKAARKKYFDENDKLKELQSQFKAADDLRQQAYTNLQNLRKEFYEKNEYFRMYRDDMKAANDYAFSGDKEALQRLCVKQVETIMELWNKNDEFRSEYVRCNTMSTLRRLRTLDGRSLGPDEAPPMISNSLDDRVDDAVLTLTKTNSIKPVSTSEQEYPVLSVVPEKTDSLSVTKVEQKSQTAKQKKPTRATVLENGSAADFGMEEMEQQNEDKHKRTEEEEELARKLEELRKEETAARLKEQHRLEEKAKAKEAEERRRRKAEIAQARAKLRAQKEAENREKEREKRARKKERREAAAQDTNGNSQGESAEKIQAESPGEPEIEENLVAVAKRHKKPTSLVKQARTKPISLPLRRRGKRGMQLWMWILLMAMLVLVLFLVGDTGISSKFGLPRFGF